MDEEDQTWTKHTENHLMQHNSSSHELSDSIVRSNFKISFTDERGRDALLVLLVVQGMSPPIETFYHKTNQLAVSYI